MINYYVVQNHAIHALSEEELKTGSTQPIWINIIDPTIEEEQIMKDSFGINVSKNNMATPITLPSCYYKSNGEVFTTMSIVTDDNRMENLVYIVSTARLVTIRSTAVPANIAYLSYVALNNPEIITPVSIYTYFMEARLIHIKENIQKVSDNIDTISEVTFYQSPAAQNQKRDFKQDINSLGKSGHLLSRTNESLLSIHRALSVINESKEFELSAMERDKINALIIESVTLSDQISFSSSKIDFLLNICFGMIGLKQSDISKVFSVAALVFLPPAIITSAYGMNFDKIPFSHFDYGFELALVVVLLSACLPYLVCKLKNWI